jgi:hypothetical protein
MIAITVFLLHVQYTVQTTYILTYIMIIYIHTVQVFSLNLKIPFSKNAAEYDHSTVD